MFRLNHPLRTPHLRAEFPERIVRATRGFTVYIYNAHNALFNLFPRRRKNVDEIFCAVRLDMERGRTFPCVEQDHIVCFSVTRYRFIRFLFRVFYIIIYTYTVSSRKFMSNMQILKHVVSLKVFNFIFPAYGFFFLT